jgi:hypothetical protein
MIKDKDYNRARSMLVAAGSMSAQKSHLKHTQGRGSPDGHGRSLLNEASAEWPNPTHIQTTALTNAADEMGIDWP